MSIPKDPAIEQLVRDTHGDQGRFDAYGHKLNSRGDFDYNAWGAYWLYHNGDLSEDFKDGHNKGAVKILKKINQKPDSDIHPSHETPVVHLMRHSGVIRVGTDRDRKSTYFHIVGSPTHEQMRKIAQFARIAEKDYNHGVWFEYTPDDGSVSHNFYSLEHLKYYLETIMPVPKNAAIEDHIRKILAGLDLLDSLNPRLAQKGDEALKRTAQNYIAPIQSPPSGGAMSAPAMGSATDSASMMTHLETLQRGIAMQIQQAMQLLTKLKQMQQPASQIQQHPGTQQGVPGVQPAPAVSQPGITLPLGTNNLNIWDGSKLNLHPIGEGDFNFNQQA